MFVTACRVLDRVPDLDRRSWSADGRDRRGLVDRYRRARTDEDEHRRRGRGPAPPCRSVPGGRRRVGHPAVVDVGLRDDVRGVPCTSVSPAPARSARSRHVTARPSDPRRTRRRSTLPVFVMTYEYWIVSPSLDGASPRSDAFATFSNSSPGTPRPRAPSSTTAPTPARSKPVASVPVAVAVSTTLPTSTSVCLTRYGARRVQSPTPRGPAPAAPARAGDAPGGRVRTATEVSGTLPVFVTL